MIHHCCWIRVKKAGQVSTTLFIRWQMNHVMIVFVRLQPLSAFLQTQVCVDCMFSVRCQRGTWCDKAFCTSLSHSLTTWQHSFHRSLWKHRLRCLWIVSKLIIPAPFIHLRPPFELRKQVRLSQIWSTHIVWQGLVSLNIQFPGMSSRCHKWQHMSW